MQIPFFSTKVEVWKLIYILWDIIKYELLKVKFKIQIITTIKLFINEESGGFWLLSYLPRPILQLFTFYIPYFKQHRR
jgi:hypothetical protein